VGGAPLTAAYAEQIGADAYCFDAMSAVDYVRHTVERT
jgi:methanogenic corrinoid protein MtbC1